MYKQNQKGFTLIEIIGVMAVIAIIASIATPRIFSAIEDAKVTALVSQTKTLNAAATSFYKDTGIWPRHRPEDADDKYHQLFVNKGSNGQPIAGWDGPYLDQEITNLIAPGSYHELVVTNSAALTCDLNGDGTADGDFLVYVASGIPESVARKASNMLDKDGGNETGDSSWKKAGRVKRHGGNSTSTLIFCLGRV